MDEFSLGDPIHFMHAVVNRDCPKIRELADTIDVDIISTMEWYAMGHAARHGHLDVIECLLELGSKMINGPKGKMSPLEHAIKGRQFDAICLLVDRGANVNKINSYGETLYTYAIFCGFGEIADLLCRLGFRVTYHAPPMSRRAHENLRLHAAFFL